MISVRKIDSCGICVNDRQHSFDQRIDEIIELGDKVIILLNTDYFDYGDPMVGRNVLCYGADGELLWRVADHGCVIHARHDDPVTQPDEEGERYVPQSILGMDIEEGTGKIKIGLPDWHYTVDPETGELSDMEYNR